MCERPYQDKTLSAPGEIPIGHATSTLGGIWLIADTPMLLHTFEYITRNALLAWWRATESARRV
jgi:hypothetical protein